jgi:hypothetical protein
MIVQLAMMDIFNKICNADKIDTGSGGAGSSGAGSGGGAATTSQTIGTDEKIEIVLN